MDKDGNISVDKTGKANGRGAYICNNLECLEKAIKAKRLERGEIYWQRLKFMR